jgi:hypothetical protein
VEGDDEPSDPEGEDEEEEMEEVNELDDGEISTPKVKETRAMT